MKFIKRLDEIINRLEGGMLIVFLSVMVVLAFLQVALRNLFSSGIVWADILLRHLVLWIGFLGGTLATSNYRHIHVDAFAHFMSPRIKAGVGVLTNLFGAAVCAVLWRASMTFVRNEIAAQSFVFAQIPSWYVEVIIPAGFGLQIIHFLVRSSVSAGEAMKKESAE